MINYLVLALLSSAMIGASEMENFDNATIPSMEELKGIGKTFIEKTTTLFGSANADTGAGVGQLVAHATESVPAATQSAPEIAETLTNAANILPEAPIVPAPTKELSRFAKWFEKVKSIKDINVIGSIKNGTKYVIKLPVDGTKGAWKWSKNNPKKAIAFTVLAVGLGYASYVLYQQYQEAQEDAALDA